MVGFKYENDTFLDNNLNTNDLVLYRYLNNEWIEVTIDYNFANGYLLAMLNQSGDYILGYKKNNYNYDNSNYKIILANSLANWLENNVVRTFNNNAVYYIEKGYKRPFLTENDFFAHSYNWSNLIYVDSLNEIPLGAPMMPNDDYNLSNATLVKGEELSKVYFLNTLLEKAWIKTEEIFYSLGYAFNNVVTLTEDKIKSLINTKDVDQFKRPDDSLVRYEGEANIYIIKENKKYLVELDQFFKNEFKYENVVIIKKDEIYEDGGLF